MGLASIALRQAVAPISVETVESIVVDAIFDFVREHPDIGIGASGMRGSGSSWLAFPVAYTEDQIQQTLTEFEKLIERKVKETRGLIQFEEKPHAYRTSKIMDHGAYGYPVRPPSYLQLPSESIHSRLRYLHKYCDSCGVGVDPFRRVSKDPSVHISNENLIKRDFPRLE